ncbi:MAG: 4'-phosphopantetheinyl transferase family protein [Steroidobacteraceae bacterium]
MDCIVAYRPLAGLSRARLGERWLHVLPRAKRAAVETAADPVAIATLAGIDLLAHGLGAIGGGELTAGMLAYPSRGKPLLGQGPDFSISHTGGFAVCAVARESRVGIDIEVLARVRPESLRRVAHPTELERFAADPYGAAKLWTRKEAVLKAAGASIFDAAAVEVEEGHADFHGERWYFSGPEVLDGCALAIAGERPHMSVDLRLAGELA